MSSSSCSFPSSDNQEYPTCQRKTSKNRREWNIVLLIRSNMNWTKVDSLVSRGIANPLISQRYNTYHYQSYANNRCSFHTGPPRGIALKRVPLIWSLTL